MGTVSFSETIVMGFLFIQGIISDKYFGGSLGIGVKICYSAA